MSEQRPPAVDEEPVRRAVTWGLIVLGWLWLALAGGCTLVFVGMSAWGLISSSIGGGPSYDAPYAAVVLVGALIVGGPAMLLGWLILHAGRGLKQGRRPVVLGWLFVVLGGLWTAEAVLRAVALAVLLARSNGSAAVGGALSLGGGAIPFELVNLLLPLALLTAGIFILRTRPAPPNG
jgi:hypothetical protein